MKANYILSTVLFLLCMGFQSFATETEPNNTRSTANTLALNGSNSGAIGAAADEDWWKVTTTGDGKVSVNITVSNGLYIRCFFYDNDGATQLNYAITAGGPVTLATDGLATGTYYVRLISYYAGETPVYTISNAFTPPAQANDTEPNDTRATAKVLPLGGTRTGHINYYYNLQRDPEDWWKVTTTGNGKLDISVTSHNSQYIRCYLFDNNGSIQLNYAETAGGPVTLATDGLAAGTYYIRIVAYYSTGFAPYTLSSSFTAPAQANDTEPDSTRAQALTLPLNGSTSGHINYYYNNYRDTLDWYKVTTNADGRLRIRLTSHNGQYIRCYLYDNNGTTQLGYFETAGTSEINTNGLSAGTYYVMLKAYYTTGFIPYTIADSLFSPVQANDTEPNDTKLQALSFGLNSTTTGHCSYYYNLKRDTFDWYKVIVPVDGMLTLTLSSHNSLYIRSYLFDEDGTTQLNYMETAGTSTIKTDGLAAGTYYIRLQPFYLTEYMPYTLINSFTPYNFSNDGTAEPNDAAYLAKTIPANDSVQGHINFWNNGGIKNGTDWWKINYTGTGNMTIRLYEEAWKYNGTYHYWRFSVYKDTNSSAIYYAEPSSAAFTVNFTSLTQGYYWIKLQPFYSGEFLSYALKTEFTQTSIATINLLNTTAQTNCDATGVIRLQCGGSKPPYKVILYRFGVVYGSPIIVNNTSPFNVTGLPTGYWRARAYGDGATGTAYGQSNATSLMPVPTGLSTTNIQATQARLNFGTFTPCVDGYAVQYRKTGETIWNLDTAVKSPFTLKNLSPGTKYTWRVTSGDTANGFTALGKYSDSVTFTTLAAVYTFAGNSENSTSDLLNNTAVAAYPNPAQSQIKFHLSNTMKGIYTVTLKDINGKVVWIRRNTEMTALNSITVNVANWPNGIYLLEIAGNNEPVIHQKIIVSH